MPVKREELILDIVCCILLYPAALQMLLRNVKTVRGAHRTEQENPEWNRPGNPQRTFSDDRMPAVTAVFTFVYICAAVGALFLAAALHGAGILLMAGAVALAPFSLFWMARRIREHGQEYQKGMAALAVTYAAVILAATLLLRDGGHMGVLDRRLNLQAFEPLVLMMQNGLQSAREELRHMALNVLLFVPFGGLLILTRKGSDTEDSDSQKGSGVLECTLDGMLLSVCIELIQLAGQLGECDVNDVMANTAGCLVGVVIADLLSKGAEYSDG